MVHVKLSPYALRRFASRGGSRTAHAIILTDSMSLLQNAKRGIGSPDGKCRHPPSKTPVWALPGVKGNDRADRLAGKAALTSELLLGRFEVLRNLRHYLRAQSQERHTIDRLGERGVERGSARRSSFERTRRGPSSVRRTLEPFQRQRWENFRETGWSAYGLFRARRYYLELN